MSVKRSAAIRFENQRHALEQTHEGSQEGCYELGMCGLYHWRSESDIVEMGRGLFPELMYELPWLFSDEDKAWFTKEEMSRARWSSRHRPKSALKSPLQS